MAPPDKFLKTELYNEEVFTVSEMNALKFPYYIMVSGDIYKVSGECLDCVWCLYGGQVSVRYMDGLVYHRGISQV